MHYYDSIGIENVPILGLERINGGKEKADLEALFKLLKEKTEIGIHDVAHAAGLSKSERRRSKGHSSSAHRLGGLWAS